MSANVRTAPKVTSVVAKKICRRMFYGSRQMMRHLAREGVTVGRHRVRRLMRLLGLEAIYRKPNTNMSSKKLGGSSKARM